MISSRFPGACLALVASLAASLSGCMVGPDFKRPDPPKDESYLTPETVVAETVSSNVLGGEAQRYVQGLDIPGQWWTVFQSRPLDDMIQKALAANPDVQAAIAALKIAQQNARAQRAALFPQVGLSGSATQNEQPSVISPTLASGNSIFGLFTGFLLGLVAGAEVPVIGRKEDQENDRNEKISRLFVLHGKGGGALDYADGGVAGALESLSSLMREAIASRSCSSSESLFASG